MWWMALVNKAQQGGNEARERSEGRDYGAEPRLEPVQPAPQTTADTDVNGVADVEPVATPQAQPSTNADTEIGAEQEPSGNGGAKAKAAFQKIGSMMQQGGQKQRKRQDWGAY